MGSNGLQAVKEWGSFVNDTRNMGIKTKFRIECDT